MRDIFADVRFALRTLTKSPVFTAVAVLSLALGIGANTAIFSLLDQVILRRLPVKNPEQLVQLKWEGPYYGGNTGFASLSYPLYRDFRDRNQVFLGVICRYALPLNLGVAGRSERLQGELVSGNYFQVLGVKAAIGRLIAPEDDRIPDGHPLAVLSYDFWAQRFHSDPDVIGKSLMINGHRLTVIGVSQKGFDGVEVGYSPKIRIPVAMKAAMTPGWEMYSLERRRGRWVNVFARLKPGVTIAQAKASLQPLFHSILQMEVLEPEFAHADVYTKEQFLRATIDVLPGSHGRSMLRMFVETPLWVLMSMVGLLLLIACANVANLLLARAAGRQREIAVRLALGASRLRIVRQLLVESVSLALAGAAAGLLIAAWTDSLLLRFLPSGDSPLPLSSSPDMRILLFTLAVACLTGIVFGLVPALQSTRTDLASTLKETAGAVLGGRMRSRTVLVVAQVFLSLLLLIGAGLFVRSVRNLQTLNPGFRTHNVIAFSLDPRLSGFTKAQAPGLYRELLQKLRATPGVDSAALALVRLLDDDWENSIVVEGYEPKPGDDVSTYFNAVSPDYFATLGIPIVAGRPFLPSDVANSRKVGIVNQAWAKKYFGARNPIGRHFGFSKDSTSPADIEIVGVMRDAKYNNMREEIPPQNFVPYAQTDYFTSVTVYVHTQLNPDQMFGGIRTTVHNLDANTPVFGMRTLDAQLDQSLDTERLTALLAAAFGLIATLLAAIGLYGVMAYAVGRRTREIGIRMALGAPRPSVLWLVMREVLLILAVGVAAALPAAWALSRFVSSQLYGVTPNDPVNIAAATVAIVIVAALSGYIPARRATRIDPLSALRYE